MPSPRRTFLHLVACVAIALGAAMSEVWSLGPRQRRGARRLEIELDRIEVQIRILCAWFRRSRRRPRYSHHEWLLIIEHAERWALSAAEMARDVVVSPTTAHRRRRQRREAANRREKFSGKCVARLGSLRLTRQTIAPWCRLRT